jgi:hypothetical protein
VRSPLIWAHNNRNRAVRASSAFAADANANAKTATQTVAAPTVLRNTGRTPDWTATMARPNARVNRRDSTPRRLHGAIAP